MFAVLVGTVVAAFIYMQATFLQSESYGALVYALVFLLSAGSGAAETMDAPAAFVSQEGYALAMQGVWTLQFAGLALIFLVGTLLATLAYSYARALVLAVSVRVRAGEKPQFLRMFGDARPMIKRSFCASAPFSMLAWVILMAYLPAVISEWYALLGGTVPSILVYNIIMFVCGIFILLFAAASVAIEASIIRKESNSWSIAVNSFAMHPKQMLYALIFSGALTGVILLFDALRLGAARALGNPLLMLFSTVILFVVVSLWRVWATGFGAALLPLPEQSRTQRTPLDE
jgi:hypothetical protein